MMIVRYGDAGEVRHHDGGRAHDRRHDLTGARRGRLDAAREGRRKPALLDHRNRDDPGRDHVGHRAARHGSEQAGGEDGGMGRPAAKPLGEVHRELDQRPSAAGPLQHRPKHDEGEHREDDDSHDCAKDAVALVEPQVLGGIREVDTGGLENPRPVLAGVEIDQRQDADDRQRRAPHLPAEDDKYTGGEHRDPEVEQPDLAEAKRLRLDLDRVVDPEHVPGQRQDRDVDQEAKPSPVGPSPGECLRERVARHHQENGGAKEERAKNDRRIGAETWKNPVGRHRVRYADHRQCCRYGEHRVADRTGGRPLFCVLVHRGRRGGMVRTIRRSSSGCGRA